MLPTHVNVRPPPALPGSPVPSGLRMKADHADSPAPPPADRGWVWWCLPALLVGLGMRVALTWAMPFAYWHPDSSDLLQTAAAFFKDGSWLLHGKKTFFVPALYAGLFRLTDHAAFWAVVLQHTLGLVGVGLVGWLVREWFGHWRWVILPATFLAAIHPALIWYEHMLMTESWMVLAVVSLAAAGTRFSRNPSPRSFALLVTALILIAGIRPEGKLWWVYGVTLTLWISRRSLRHLALRAAVLVVAFLAIRPGIQTTQAPMLFFSTVLHLAPDEFEKYPGLGARLRPLRDHYIALWNGVPNDLSRARKDLDEALDAYVKEHPEAKPRKRSGEAPLVTTLSRQIVLANWWRMPGLAWSKFCFVSRGLAGDEFTQKWLGTKHTDSLQKSRRVLEVLGARLTGDPYTPDDAAGFVAAHYPESVPWFERLTQVWTDAVSFPAAGPLPLWLWLALPGLALLPLMQAPGERVSVALWSLSVAGVLFAVMLAANPRPRFRCQFELPLALAALATLHTAGAGAASVFRRKSPESR